MVDRLEDRLLISNRCRKGWDPRLQALLSVVEQTQKWRMLTSRE